MMKTTTLALLFSLFLLLPATAENYRFSAKESQVGFEIKHLGGLAKGQFKEFQGELEFYPDDPERSKVRIVIQVDSLKTGSAKRDAHLQQDDFFDSAKYPVITFESKKFRKVGASYRVTGPMTMHGQSKNITLQVQLKKRQTLWTTGAEALDFQSFYELDRHDFGVSGSPSLINDEVKIVLNIRAISR